MRAVWCEMRQDDGGWSRPRLILATETDLSAQEVVEIYAERWGIEPLFHNLKRWWGVANLWQQSKEALELWMQIRCTAYALTQLLALKLWESFPLMDIAPWRKGAMITAGLFGQWMRIQFIGLRVRNAFDAKSGQFRDAFPRSGSAFAVLSRVALRRSASNRRVLVFVMARHRRNSGRRAVACV